MELLNKLLERVLQLDERYLINQILNNQEIKNWLIKMNKEQLFVDGVNNLGIKLDVADKVGGYTVSGFYKGYSPFTKEKKKEKGLPSDHVTLYDTGEFYDSFKVEIDGDIEFTANSMKDGEDLFDRWGVEVLGLTEENTEKLKEYLKNEIISQIRKAA